MSGFTRGCRSQAAGAWQLAGSLPQKYSAWKKGPSLAGRAERGCLGCAIFGVGYLLVPITVFVFVELAVCGYALLATLLWGIGSGVDLLARRRSTAAPSVASPAAATTLPPGPSPPPPPPAPSG
jgi:hypothetical protein